MGRIPSLDGVRAIAISLVVWGHWAETNFHSDIAGAYASLGRRIFFVLSGYLITMLLMRERDKTSTIQLKRFYVRRAYRILPAAIVFLATVILIHGHETRWYHLAAAGFYVVNFDFAPPWFIGHLWSVSVQEQFYFLWPLTLKKWHRYRIPILVAAIAFSPVYRIACHLLQLHGRADRTFPAVADILAIGCLLALFEKRLPRVRARWALLMIVPLVSVPVYMGSLHFHITPGLLLLWWPALHVSIAGLLLHVMQQPYRSLNLQPVAWLGKLSYGLYLWQQLFVFGPHQRPWFFTLLAVAAAGGSYYLIEQPMLRLREKQSPKRKPGQVLVPAA